MLEELLEHGTHGDDVPKSLEIAILVFVCIFYSFSFLELLHLSFRPMGMDAKEITIYKNDPLRIKQEKRKTNFRWAHTTNTLFQILLNLSFFILRIIMWAKYKRDAAIFLTKNLISIVINVMPYLIARGYIDDKSDDDDDDDEASGVVVENQATNSEGN